MWAIITKDSTDEFEDKASGDVDLHAVEFYDNWDEAKKQYDEVKDVLSNVYLTKVIDKEVCI